MFLVWNKRIMPPHEFHHDPKLYNMNGNTVALLLLKRKFEVPDEWKYDPEYLIKHRFSDHYNYVTTAFILAVNKTIPPKYFNHDPIIRDHI